MYGKTRRRWYTRYLTKVVCFHAEASSMSRRTASDTTPKQWKLPYSPFKLFRYFYSYNELVAD
jgi:hypothetical protein